MADESYVVELVIDTANSLATVRQLANIIATLNQDLKDPALSRAEQNLAKFGNTANGAATNSKNAQKSVDGLNQSLSTTRYALYSASATLGVMGAALLAIPGVVYKAAISFEQQFANVIRTSQVASDQIDTLRGNFIDLASAIPVSFSKLAEIGTLGGQLGVDAADLSNFTSTVAKFSATTNLSVDAAATAFGRLDALLPDVHGNYESLADSIVKVGVNSVATESQIVNIAQQIASMSAVVGLSSKEVIGLSGAMASLGIAPELARSTITRSFTQILSVISSGGVQLDKFGAAIGLTGDQFAKSFRSDALGTFEKVLASINEQGPNAVNQLKDLGLYTIRNGPALLKMAQNLDIVTKSVNDANTATGTLNQQFSIISGTVAAKLQILQNNFNNLFAGIGEGGGVFGGLIDDLNSVLVQLTAISRNPVANFFLQTGVIVIGLTGILTLLAAAAARGYAGLIGIVQGLRGIAAETGATEVGLGTLTAQLDSMGFAGRGAALAIRGLGLASIATLGAIVAFAELQGTTGAISGLRDQILGLNNDLESVQKRLATKGNADLLGGNAFNTSGLVSFVEEVQRNLANVGLTTNKTGQDLKTLDEGFTQIAQSGQINALNKDLKELAARSGVSVDQLLTKLPNTKAQLDLFAASGQKATDSASGLTSAADLAAAAQQSLADSLGITTDQLSSLQTGLSQGSAAFVNLGSLITATNKSGISDITAFNDALEAQVTALTNWQSNLLKLAASGASADVISQLAGLGPAGAQIVQQAVDDIGGQGKRLVGLLSQTGADASSGLASAFTANLSLIQQAFAQGGQGAADALERALIGGSPAAVAAVVAQYNLNLKNNPLQIVADAASVENTINSVIARNTGRTITLHIAGSGQIEGHVSGSSVIFRRDGGYISGNGTGTSDSIPARLSNGEYVIRAASVRQYGVGLFDQLNRGVKAFAAGGYVGGGSTSFPDSMMTSMSPDDRAIMRGLGNRPVMVSVSLTDEQISRAAQRGDQTRVARGDLRP